jgi:hypothetical protein
MTRVPLVLALLAAASAPALAQADRITIKLVPVANQTLRFHNTQDMEMTTDSVERPDAPSPMPPMAMVMHFAMDTTSTIGPTDDQGHYTARMTIDQLSVSSTMNGKPMPLPATLGDSVEKPVMTVSYDDQGKMTDIAMDGGPAGVTDALKQLITRASATLAPMTLSVGETVTVPVALNLPIPGGPMPGAVAPAGMGMSGETQYTLTAVTFDGADRIAHLTLRVSNRMTPAASAGATPMAFAMTVTGDGKMDVNVDRGIILHSEQRATMETSMQPPAVGSAMPEMRMHGKVSSGSDFVK